jgi:hypothetical protein
MKNIITFIALCIVTLLGAQVMPTPPQAAPGKFEQGMGMAMKMWGEGKNDEATAMFERIAAAEKTSWLPNYYVALVNTSAAFGTKDKTKIDALLTKSQAALDVELNKDPSNAELIVMQAMIHTAWIAFDPMTNGMKLSRTVKELYMKAYAIAPENPRVVFGQAEFEIGGAKWTGADVKALCKDIDKSLELFAKFKPETPFSPNWGVERAKKAAENCKQ